MNRAALFAAVALPTVVVLLAAVSAGPSSAGPETDAPPVVAAPLAAPVESGAPVRRPSPLPTARRALHWLLAAETGDLRRLPAATFARPLARELHARPPRTAPNRRRARVAGLREQAPLGPVRRVLADIERDGRYEHATLLVTCRHACLVAAVE